MPKVGNKKMKYDKEGMKKARKEAKKTGKKIEYGPNSSGRHHRGGMDY